MQGSRRHWSLKCVLIGLLLTPVTHAAGIGFYAGIQLGYGKNNQEIFTSADVASDAARVADSAQEDTILIKYPAPPNIQPITPNTVVAKLFSLSVPIVTSFNTATKDNLFMGRLFFGYQFKTWLGAEMGFSGYSNTNLRYNATVLPGNANAELVSVNNLPVYTGTLNSSYNSVYRRDVNSLQAVDFLLKLSLPFYDLFDIYGKIGGAFIHTKTEGRIEVGGLNNITYTGNPHIGYSASTFNGKRSRSQNTASPAIAIGGEYFFTPSISVNASWNSILINLKSNNNTTQNKINNNLNYFAIGLTYHMVDRYCGQFLCDD